MVNSLLNILIQAIKCWANFNIRAKKRRPITISQKLIDVLRGNIFQLSVGEALRKKL